MAHVLVSTFTVIWIAALSVFFSACLFHRLCLLLVRCRWCAPIIRVDYLFGNLWFRIINYFDIGDPVRTRRDLATLERALQLRRGTYGQLSEERSSSTGDAQER